MELIKIVNARRVLDSLANKEDISAHLSYWMAKFVAKTESEYNFYVTGMHKLFDKYATKNGDDNAAICIPAENVDEFNSAVEELNKTNVEDPHIRFSLSELSAELKLSMKQIYPLLDFIDEEK
nr:MAG TPA: Protein of unknown function (DUF1617) [Caudoviricetes sp.]